MHSNLIRITYRVVQKVSHYQLINKIVLRTEKRKHREIEENFT